MRRIAIAMTTAVLAIGASHAAEMKILIPQQRQATLKSTYVACQTADDVEKLGQLLYQRDFTAAAIFSLSHCPDKLQAGTRVFIEKKGTGQINGALCVRAELDTDCLWIWAFADLNDPSKKQP